MKEYLKDIGIIAICVSLLAGVWITNDYFTRPHKKDNVFISIERSNGNSETLGFHNLITDIGENYERDILGFDNVTGNNATKWISLSNDATPAVTWTKLANEATASGAIRVLGNVTAWVYSGDYSYNVTARFDFSGTITLQTAGEQWSGQSLSDNNLYACAAFTQTTFNSGDTLTVTWVNTQDDN